MSRKPYPSDLSDAQWKRLQAVLPAPKNGRSGRPRRHELREVVKALLYQARLFSVVTLLAHGLSLKQPKGPPMRRTAWYRKGKATFSDALAWVRCRIWSHQHHSFYISPFKTDIQESQHQLIHQMAELLCYAA